MYDILLSFYYLPVVASSLVKEFIKTGLVTFKGDLVSWKLVESLQFAGYEVFVTMAGEKVSAISVMAGFSRRKAGG